ncbi:uncharacterized protein LOC134846449 [Symsagittifera roscoffensis]|uniref:uncharacterized protein LOC134846449 n=1 Tax=Symsagittifera roscoffensis TaxID=84072 RepID=UPI00307C04CB
MSLPRGRTDGWKVTSLSAGSCTSPCELGETTTSHEVQGFIPGSLQEISVVTHIAVPVYPRIQGEAYNFFVTLIPATPTWTASPSSTSDSITVYYSVEHQISGVHLDSDFGSCISVCDASGLTTYTVTGIDPGTVTKIGVQAFIFHGSQHGRHFGEKLEQDYATKPVVPSAVNFANTETTISSSFVQSAGHANGWLVTSSGGSCTAGCTVQASSPHVTISGLLPGTEYSITVEPFATVSAGVTVMGVVYQSAWSTAPPAG